MHEHDGMRFTRGCIAGGNETRARAKTSVRLLGSVSKGECDGIRTDMTESGRMGEQEIANCNEVRTTRGRAGHWSWSRQRYDCGLSRAMSVNRRRGEQKRLQRIQRKYNGADDTVQRARDGQKSGSGTSVRLIKL